MKAKFKDFNSAALDFDAASRLDPKDPVIYYDWGCLETKLSNSYEAIRCFTIAIGLRPDYDAAFYNRGYEYYNQRKFELALADFSKAIEINPKDGKSYWHRGDIKRILHLQDPCVDYQKSVELGVPEGKSAVKRYCQ